jgi:hypothetical protein
MVSDSYLAMQLFAMLDEMKHTLVTITFAALASSAKPLRRVHTQLAWPLGVYRSAARAAACPPLLHELVAAVASERRLPRHRCVMSYSACPHLPNIHPPTCVLAGHQGGHRCHAAKGSTLLGVWCQRRGVAGGCVAKGY